MNASPLRVASPSMMIAALVAFCLPWINVRCANPDGGAVHVTQSGLQAALGQTTVMFERPDGQILREGDPLFPVEDAFNGGGIDGGELDQNRGAVPGFEQSGKGAEAAPAMILYALLLAAGAIAGFVIEADDTRRLVVGGCGAAAAVCLILQTAVGFPLPNNLARQLQEIPFEVTYSIWFWAAMAVTLAAPAAVLVEYAVYRNRRDALWQDPERRDAPA